MPSSCNPKASLRRPASWCLKPLPRSPAFAAGLRAGDIIVAVGDTPIPDVDEFFRVLERFEAGEKVSLVRVRGATDEATIFVVLAGNAAPEQSGSESRPQKTKRSLEKRSTKREAVDDQSRSRGGNAGESAYVAVRVYYATDRNRTNSSDPGQMYGSDRGSLVYGACDVTIPKIHQIGELETPSLLRVEFSEDPAKHIVLATAKEQSAPEFYQEIGAKMTASGEKSALVFVHGYNVTFKNAALRTAQMAHDLKYAGVPIFFSWPSQGKYMGYVFDESNVDYARSDLKKFLKEFAQTSPADKIYLVAHSLGNRALVSAVADLLRESPEARAKIAEVILAAPDIDADLFKREIAPAIVGPDRSVTLYASSNDLALRVSQAFHGYPRAGESGDRLTVAPGLVTIDSSAVQTDFLGHSYFADSSLMIDDILEIIAGRRNPADRTHLIAVEDAAGKYWKIQSANRP